MHPDLAIYGKAMAAGWPCAAIAGRRDLFDEVASGAVTHAGTFNGNAVAVAAVLASLDELESGEVYERINEVGTGLMAELRAAMPRAAPARPADGLPRKLRAGRGADHQVQRTRGGRLR